MRKLEWIRFIGEKAPDMVEGAKLHLDFITAFEETPIRLLIEKTRQRALLFRLVAVQALLANERIEPDEDFDEQLYGEATRDMDEEAKLVFDLFPKLIMHECLKGPNLYRHPQIRAAARAALELVLSAEDRDDVFCSISGDFGKIEESLGREILDQYLAWLNEKLDEIANTFRLSF